MTQGRLPHPGIPRSGGNSKLFTKAVFYSVRIYFPNVVRWRIGGVFREVNNIKSLQQKDSSNMPRGEKASCYNLEEIVGYLFSKRG
jgi:hypothetical protein